MKPNAKDLRRIKVIRDNVRALRELNGMTQVELADRSGLSLGSVREIESRNRGGFSVVLLMHLADAFKVPITALLKGFK